MPDPVPVFVLRFDGVEAPFDGIDVSDDDEATERECDGEVVKPDTTDSDVPATQFAVSTGKRRMRPWISQAPRAG